ncbi:MAG: bifunctional nuclease family protein [Chloroflexi bacterium]|nr:bifunctional nuclease family protein [Chloroflexota bacterium]
MKEMIVDSIRVSLVGYQRVVVLKVKGVERYLLIWVGNPEAGSIALALQEIAMPRPLTHDLLRSVIEHLGGRVESVIINDLVDNTFYARIVMGTDGRRLEVDARPSDAIALALRVNVPIYAEDSVLDRAGISPDAEPMTKEEQDKLTVFRNFVNTLDFNDS